MQSYSIRLSTVEESENSVATSTDHLRSSLEILLHHTLVLSLLRSGLVGTCVVSNVARGYFGDVVAEDLLKHGDIGPMP